MVRSCHCSVHTACGLLEVAGCVWGRENVAADLVASLYAYCCIYAPCFSFETVFLCMLVFCVCFSVDEKGREERRA